MPTTQLQRLLTFSALARRLDVPASRLMQLRERGLAAPTAILQNGNELFAEDIVEPLRRTVSETRRRRHTIL